MPVQRKTAAFNRQYPKAYFEMWFTTGCSHPTKPALCDMRQSALLCWYNFILFLYATLE